MNLNEYLNMPIEIGQELSQIFPKEESIIIFDIGACEAEDTIKYSRFFPNSKIYSFEPIPNNFNKGLKNLEDYSVKNAELFKLALSNSDGEAEFFVSEGHPDYLAKQDDWDYGNKSSSLLPAKDLSAHYNWLNLNNSIKVETMKLSSFCKNNNIDKIDFIHMDVQGAELMVLEGAEDFLDKIKAIWLEVELVELYKGQPLKNAVVEFLSKHGFSVIKDTCNHISGDILCIKK